MSVQMLLSARMGETYAHGDVSGNTLIIPVLAEDAECGSQSALEIRSFLVWVVELGWAGECDSLHPRLLLIQTWLEGSSVAGLCLAAILGLDRRWRCHGVNVAAYRYV